MLHCLTCSQTLPIGLTEAWAFFSNPANKDIDLDPLPLLAITKPWKIVDRLEHDLGHPLQLSKQEQNIGSTGAH